jgi:nucleoid DNA-binding protein
MDKRKLKPTHLRKAKPIVPHAEIVKQVSRNTGFTKSDVEEVIEEYLRMVKDHIVDRSPVRFKGIGIVYAMVKPAKCGVNMGGSNVNTYEKIVTPPTWRMTFKAEESLRNEVKDIVVTKRDLDNIYYNE